MSNNLFEPFDQIQNVIIEAQTGSSPAKKPATEGPSASSKHLALEKELEQLTALNRTMKGVLGSIGSTKTNLTTLLQTTNQTNSLLEIWIKILNQAGHNQLLLLDPTWQGNLTNETEDHERVAQLNDVMNRIEATKRKQEQEAQQRQTLEEARMQRFQEKQTIIRRRGVPTPRGGVSARRIAKERR